MLSTDRDALVCDLAETYHVLDMTALPVPLLATLAAGLRGDSRVRMRMEREPVDSHTMLQAAILDRLTTLCWMQSTDGAHGRKRPPSVVEAMAGKETARTQPAAARPVAFATPAEFDRAWASITGNGRETSCRRR